MPHVDEIVPADEIETMLHDQWNEHEGHVPRPTFVVVGNPDEVIRYDTYQEDVVIIRLDTPGLIEQPIGPWIYGNRTHRILLELYTRVSRQRLYNLNKEIRRIYHNQMHLTDAFQRIQYQNFNELTQTTQQFWTGRIITEVVNFAVLLET